MPENADQRALKRDARDAPGAAKRAFLMPGICLSPLARELRTAETTASVEGAEKTVHARARSRPLPRFVHCTRGSPYGTLRSMPLVAWRSGDDLATWVGSRAHEHTHVLQQASILRARPKAARG
jgi:heme-degrading monooxygenase HmoA